MTGVAVGALRDPDTTVAEGINWTVNAGDYWVVAGLHGSGKSDFLMLTGGLMAPRQGRYRFFGEEMPIFEEARLKERLRLGLVFEGGQLFNHLTVAENVALPLRYHHNLSRSEAAAAVSELLACTELAPWAESTPGALGRSWQKRAGLARALALKPEVLLVDNPLAGLDPQHVHWWLGFLDQLSKGHRLTARPAGDAGGHDRRFPPLERPRPAVCDFKEPPVSRCSAPGLNWRRRARNWCGSC